VRAVSRAHAAAKLAPRSRGAHLRGMLIVAAGIVVVLFAVELREVLNRRTAR
jgi:hypothetical protein